MKKSRVYIFFDDIIIGYKIKFLSDWEKLLISELQECFCNLYKNTDIMLITNQKIPTVTKWLCENNLYHYIYDISNPSISDLKTQI